MSNNTPYDRRWPNDPEFAHLGQKWAFSASSKIIGFIWDGCESISDLLKDADFDGSEDEIERSITQQLVPLIRRSMSGNEPYDVEHGPYEFETRKKPPAQPPQYDIGFVLFNNQKIVWPIEAKTITDNASIKRYVKEVKGNYLTCRYAPFSNGGAMLGYLINDVATNIFPKINDKLGVTLKKDLSYKNEYHRISSHVRTSPPGKNYVSRFDCHHLIVEFKTGH